MQLFLLTRTAMLFFAANSVLCRLALLETGMAPEAYTFLRLLSGFWPAALALFLYMAFSSLLILGGIFIAMVGRKAQR